MSKAIYIEEYSAKSFIVRGDTRIYKESLKRMGGKWNSRLTDKKTGNKFGAWLFWSDKREEIQNWIDNDFPPLKSSIGDTCTYENKILLLENRIVYLESKLEIILEKLNISEEQNIKTTEYDINTFLDDSIVMNNHKRLLRK